MKEIIEKEITISYAQVAVFLGSLDRPFNLWTDQHVKQGFAWRAESAVFRTINEAGKHLVTVFIDNEENAPSSNAERIIDVPFEVPSDNKIEIGSISESVSLEIPKGLYQLRFECFKRDNGQISKVQFTFRKHHNPRFMVVKADEELTTGSNLLTTASPA